MTLEDFNRLAGALAREDQVTLPTEEELWFFVSCAEHVPAAARDLADALWRAVFCGSPIPHPAVWQSYLGDPDELEACIRRLIIDIAHKEDELSELEEELEECRQQLSRCV